MTNESRRGDLQVAPIESLHLWRPKGRRYTPSKSAEASAGAWPWPPLRPYQVEAGRAIVESVFGRQGRTISVMMARQAGKNELSAQVEALLLAAHVHRAADAVKCAPTFQPQAKISLRRLWTRLLEAGLGSIAVREDGHIVRLGHARQGRTISVMMARQAGKNELSAQVEALLLAAHVHRAADAIKCAPTFQPQAKISLRRLWTRLLEAGLGSITVREDGHIVRLGHARQLFLSAEPHSNVVGHTAQLLLEVDEAQDVDVEKFDREFRPMAATANATTVYYGTPWDDLGLLEQARQRHLELERGDGIRRHFQYDWEEVARHNPAYGRYVETERARLGENHPLFLTQYCLRTVSGGRLFSSSQRAQLQGSHSRQQAATSGETYVAGLDLGGQDLPAAHPELIEGAAHGSTGLTMSGGGHDATVLTIARLVYPDGSAPLPEPHLEVVEHRAWSGEPHDRLLPALADLLGNVWRVRRAAVDATGLGETIARFLARALGAGIVLPFRFSAEAKSRLGYELLAAVNTGRLKVYAADGSPEYRQFWREVELARAAYRPNRTLNFYVDPSQGHDDYLMSLALMVAAAPEAGPRAARGRLREDAS